MAGQTVLLLVFFMSSTRLELRTLVGYIGQRNTKLVGNKGRFLLM